jgi:enoyl-CoA hydratase
VGEEPLPTELAWAVVQSEMLHLERAVLASLDLATTAEEQSFGTEDFRSIVAKLG